MSRGLGKLQRDILGILEERNRSCFANDIAWEIYNKDKDRERDYSNPPETFVCSVRRAIRSLKYKELVDCARGYQEDLGRYITGLFCWLPGSEQSRRFTKITPINGDEVEKAILEALAETETFDDIARYCYTKSSFEPEQIKYSWVTRHTKAYLVHRLGVNRFGDGARIAMAITRAVRRLVKKGLIKAYWRNSKGQYYWVINVSKLAITPTSIHLGENNDG